MQQNFDSNIFSLSNQNIFTEPEKIFNEIETQQNYIPVNNQQDQDLFQQYDQIEFEAQNPQPEQVQLETPVTSHQKQVKQQPQPRKFCFSDKPITIQYDQSPKGNDGTIINQQSFDSNASKNGYTQQRHDGQFSRQSQQNRQGQASNNQYGNYSQHNYTIAELKQNLLTLGCDNSDSKQLQTYFQNLSQTNRTADIDDIILTNLQHIPVLIRNQYGNYLMSVLIQVCSDSCLSKIFNTVQNQLLDLARYQFSSKAAQFIVRRCDQQETLIVYKQLQENFMVHSIDKYSCHTVQEILQKLEVVDYCDYIDFVVDHVEQIAENQFGSRIIEILLQQVNRENEQYFQPLLKALSQRASELSKNPYGNYLVIKLLKMESENTKNLIQIIINNLLQLSTDKYGSNVVEQLIHIANKQELQQIEDIILKQKSWQLLIQQSDFGHYSVQKLLSRIEEMGDQRKIQQVCETCRKFGGGNKWVDQQLDKMENNLQRL